MMKKRIARSAKALIFIVAAALLFSGFTTAGGTRLEKEAADLMLRRTEAMQRAMFHGGSDADIYSHLAAVEAHPLLKEDMESISDFRESDADKVINMKVIRCEMKKKRQIRAFLIFRSSGTCWDTTVIIRKSDLPDSYGHPGEKNVSVRYAAGMTIPIY